LALGDELGGASGDLLDQLVWQLEREVHRTLS
jgi:hypothetical protein